MQRPPTPTARRISACLLAYAVLSLATGCGGDLATGSSSGGSTSGVPSTSAADATTGNPTGADATGADSTGEPTGADGTGTTGDPPPPPVAMTLNCADEYFQDFGSNHQQLDYDLINEPTIALDPATDCPGIVEGDSFSEVVSVIIRRPTTDDSAALPPWPASPVPWVVLAHGNELNAAYDHLVQPLVEKGFAVFLIDGPFETSISTREEAIECVAKWADALYAAELGSCFGLIGHSNAGEGAFRTARSWHIENDPMASRLGAIATLGPRGPDDNFVLPVAEQTTPLLVITGSRDHDVDKGGASLYELASNEGAYNLASGLSGSVPGRTGEKVFVEAYDVSHGALGGVATSVERNRSGEGLRPADRAPTLAA